MTKGNNLNRLLTQRIIGCAMKVHNALGIGFLEKVYENAMVLELGADGLSAIQQKPIPVYYRNTVVGDYIADLIVEGKVLVELKTVSTLTDVQTSICMNYLRATNLPVCLLVNFAKPRLDWKRLVGDSYINHPEPL